MVHEKDKVFSNLMAIAVNSDDSDLEADGARASCDRCRRGEKMPQGTRSRGSSVPLCGWSERHEVVPSAPHWFCHSQMGQQSFHGETC